MASFTAGTTFVDGVSNDVTAAKLGALVNNATPTSGLIQDRTAETVVGVNDTLLIGDASDSNNLKRMTVANLLKAPLVSTSGTVDNLTTGTTTSTAQIVTSGTIATLNSTAATITTGTINTGTFGTTTSTAATITTGTINTGTFGTTTSTAATITTGTIPTLVATTLVTTGTGTAAAPAIVPTGDTNTGIFFPAADTIAFAEGGTEGMRIDSSGNVGIGTNSPSTFGVGSKLVVVGAITDASINYSATFSDGTTNQLRIGHVSGVANILTDANAVAICTAGTAELIRFAGDKIGIGTTNPSYRMDIVSGDTTNGYALRLRSDTTSTRSRIQFTNNSASTENGYIDVSDGKNMVFATGSTERARIDSSGNVGIGITGPNATLHSVSTSATTNAGIFQITATSSTSQAALSVIKQDSNTTTNQTFVLFQHAGGTNCGKINANGANTAAFGSTSDARLKENITALPSQIDNVCALRPCEFDYKDGSGHQIGFIAQEMQEVYPDSVGVGDDGMLTITAWSKTEARLVKAIQELKAKNDSLEARLEALEAK